MRSELLHSIRRGRIAAHLVSYQGMIVFNIVVGLVSFPLMFITIGASEWSQIAVAQSLGLFFAIPIGWGWAVSGPAQIASQGSAARLLTFQRSNIARAWLFLVASPIIFSTTVWIFGNSWLIPLLWIGNSIVTFMLPQWYFVGASKPFKVFLWVVLPTNLFNLLSLALLVLTKSVSIYTWIQFVTTLVTWIAATSHISKEDSHQVSRSPIAALKYLQTSWRGLVSSLFSAVYLYLPVVVVATVSPAAAPIYTLADKLLRYARSFNSTVTQWAQGYVPSGRSHERARREKIAIYMAALSGLAAGAAFFFLAPFATNLISDGTLAIPLSLLFPFSISLVIQIISQVLAWAILSGKREAKIVSWAAGITFAVNFLVTLALQSFGISIALAWGLCLGLLGGLTSLIWKVHLSGRSTK